MVSTVFRQSIFSGFSRQFANKNTLGIMVDKVAKIGTHDGVFHCDEVLGCAMLKLLSPDAKIVRSRDPEVLKTCDIVIDVGAVFDKEKLLFDHHQRDFTLTARSLVPELDSDIKLSSAGLVYCTYGKQIIKKLIGNCEDSVVDVVFIKIYDFIKEIDAIDNGVPICEGPQQYYISTNLSSRVARLNPNWNDISPNVDLQFNKAMDMAWGEFKDKVLSLFNTWLPARSLVKSAIDNRYSVDPSGEIIELEQFCPWITHFFELEKELKIDSVIKYAIFPGSQPQDAWSIRSVPVEDNSFILRKPLPENWRGLRGEELSKICGIKDCIFAHATGFIGKHPTRDGALQMARKSLEA